MSEEIHNELIQSVVDFTGATRERARKLLEESQWNVPEAVTLFFMHVDAAPALTQRRPTNNNDWSAILRMFYLAVKSCLGWAFLSCWRACKLFLLGSRSSMRRDASGSLSTYFGNLPERVPRPLCVESSFFDASAQSRQRNNRKVLLIYLNSSSSSDFEYFSKMLCTETVASIINSQFMLWAGDTTFSQPNQLLRALPVRTLPLLIAAVSVNSSELKIVAATTGRLFNEEGILEVLHKAQEEQDRLMAEDEQFKINQTLRETQDREYEEALARDRAIEEQRLHQEAEEAMKRDAKNEKRRKTMEHKEQLLKKFINAPDPQAPTTIVVRLPGGTRIERGFEMTAPVSILYEWVLCCGFLHATAEGVSDKIKVGNFSLATSFPSTKLDNMQASLESCGLVPNAVLVFSFLGDDSDME